MQALLVERPGYDPHLERWEKCKDLISRLIVLPAESTEAQCVETAIREIVDPALVPGFYEGVREDCAETRLFYVEGVEYRPDERMADRAFVVRIAALQGCRAGLLRSVSLLKLLEPRARDGYWGRRLWPEGNQDRVSVPLGFAYA